MFFVYIRRPKLTQPVSYH